MQCVDNDLPLDSFQVEFGNIREQAGSFGDVGHHLSVYTRAVSSRSTTRPLER